MKLARCYICTLQVWRQLQKYLGRAAHFLYLAWFVAYICFSSYFVWTAVHSARIASIPRLVAFIEQVCTASFTLPLGHLFQIL